ncbi:hypothetical protein WMY93_021670 [Mugilogobius chulae]|uniref:BHLH domain-containing protein n=1 Tax=Mugilogobius chulae TaxID=88201 RepID=A0AAW0NCL0_9GOBI
MSLHGSENVEKIPFAAPVVLHGAFGSRGSAHRALEARAHFFDTAFFDHVHEQIFYRRLSYLPLHRPIGVCEYTFEPAFIRKRNERERHRVRCVNEGYARLREHLPHEFEDKRLSKVETLRAAIDYIKHLESLLELKTDVAVPAQTHREEKDSVL